MFRLRAIIGPFINFDTGKNCTILHKKDYIIALCNFSCIKVYKKPDDGSKLEPKLVVVNQLIKLVFCVTDLTF